MLLTALACGDVAAPEPGRPGVETSTAGAPEVVVAEVRELVAAAGRARVVVTLHDPAPVDAPVGVRERAISSVRDEVLRGLPEDGFELVRSYAVTPAIALSVDARALAALGAHADVVRVQGDARVHGGGSLVDNGPPMDLGALRALGLDGKGVRVAVLDSGVDVTHPDLAPALVAEHCFTDGACPPSGTSEGVSARDENGHGTNVAGIIVSRGKVAPEGFAPGAGLVAVRVLDGANAGWMTDWIAGLDWVTKNLATLGVSVVNMSLATSATYPGLCDGTWPMVTSLTAQLAAHDVVVFACSGNAGEGAATSAPACNTGVVAVGATYTGDLGAQPDGAATYQALFGGSWPACADAATSVDTVACFTNASPKLDLLLPGAVVKATGLNGGTSTYRGTSQASPAAAGLAVLMQQCSPGIRRDDVVGALVGTAKSVGYPRNAQAYPRVQGMLAVQSACPCVGLGSGVPCPGGTCEAGVCVATGTGGSSGGGGAGSSGSAGSGLGGSGGSGGLGGSATGGAGASSAGAGTGGAKGGGAGASAAGAGTGGAKGGGAGASAGGAALGGAGAGGAAAGGAGLGGSGGSGGLGGSATGGARGGGAGASAGGVAVGGAGGAGAVGAGAPGDGGEAAGDGGGCSCSAPASSASPAPLALLGLSLVARSRRRRTA